MFQIIKYVAILIFAIVFLLVAGFITIKIFNKVAGDITGKIVNDITSDITKSITGGSSVKVEKKPCTLPKTQRQFKNEPYYNGPLIDSHVHFPTSSKIVSSVAGQNGLQMPVLEGDLSAENLICLFESEGIIKTFAFHITAKLAEGAPVSTAKAIEEAYPGKLVNLLMPPPVKSLLVDASTIKGILEKNKGLFKGFGEVALYRDGFEGMLPNDPYLKEIYKLAQEHNLVVMIHPEDNLKDGIEEILAEFSDVNFLFHGGRYQEWIIDLMPKYKNAYYTADDINALFGHEKEVGYQKTSTKEEYLAYMKANFDKALVKEVARWKAKIEKNPDRILWGTDRWYGWTFDPEVGAVLEEFGRSFIGRLDVSVQENFAYKNAEKILQGE